MIQDTQPRPGKKKTWRQTLACSICVREFGGCVYQFVIWNAQRNCANKAPRDPERYHEFNNLGPSAVGAAAWMLTSKVVAHG